MGRYPWEIMAAAGTLSTNPRTKHRVTKKATLGTSVTALIMQPLRGTWQTLSTLYRSPSSDHFRRVLVPSKQHSPT
jgi:hypothetical protein